jgi:putative membrane protein
MGIAELVPGVSGGTIAFVTGIYRELVASLHAIDATTIRMLLRLRVAEAWGRVNANFLLALLAGMAFSLIAFARVVSWLLANREIEVWSFFLGLILASMVYVGQHAGPWRRSRIGLAVLGVLLGALVSTGGGLPVTENLLVTFVAGAIAICAWILPGVSGSFMLLVLGQYPRVIAALSEPDLRILGVFAAGCLTGLALFTRLLTFLLRHFYGATLAFLCGFMGGSLGKLWPWRQTLSYYLDADGDAIPIVVRPVGPMHYREMYGEDPMLATAVLAALAGMALVMVLDRVGRRGAR